MDDKKIVRIFNNSVNDINKKRLDFIKNNKDVSEYLKKISKVSIQLAKMKLGNKCNGENNDLKKELDSLINHNKLYEKSNIIKYKCPICKDKGVINGKTCKCFENLVKHNRIEVMRRNLPLDSFTFENFNLDLYSNDILEGQRFSIKELMKKILNFCKKYVREFSTKSQNLIMIGNPGLGKTHISVAMAGYLLSKNFNVVYISLPNLIQDFDRERFYKKYEDSQNDILDCDFLILDDFGSEFINSFSVSVIYNILNIRGLKKFPTLIVTNLEVNEVEKKYGQKICSRIFGGFNTIRFYGDDIRQIIFRKRILSIKEKINNDMR